MAAKKFLRQVAGVLTEVFGVQTSAGAGNAGDIVSLDDTGRIDGSMMPVGIGGEIVIVTASEALAAGDFVSFWNSSGIKARKADASTTGKEAEGFVLASVSNAGQATVYFPGQANTSLASLTVGAVYYLSDSTAGGVTTTPPSTAGHIVQRLGVAVSATEIVFDPKAHIVLA